MASVSTADTWRESGARADRRAAARPEADHVSRIGRPPVPPPPARMRSTELPPFPEHLARAGRRRDEHPAPPPAAAAQRAGRPPRDADRPRDHAARDGASRHDRQGAPQREVSRHEASRYEASRHETSRDGAPDREDLAGRRGPRAPEPRSAAPRSAGRGAAPPVPERGGRVRGVVAALAVFLVTLAGAALDSWIGVGLGLVTLVTLTAASAVGALVVRRRDLLTMVVTPPLVFVLVAALNTALAPSASLNLATVATLLIRGFPAMAIATAVAAVVAILRWAARR